MYNQRGLLAINNHHTMLPVMLLDVVHWFIIEVCQTTLLNLFVGQLVHSCIVLVLLLFSSSWNTVPILVPHNKIWFYILCTTAMFWGKSPYRTKAYAKRMHTKNAVFGTTVFAYGSVWYGGAKDISFLVYSTTWAWDYCMLGSFGPTWNLTYKLPS